LNPFVLIAGILLNNPNDENIERACSIQWKDNYYLGINEFLGRD
jgi:hypothetical protein